jgi:hypothetical protein
VGTGGGYCSVYSFPPKDETMPYIVIGEQTMAPEQGTKDAYITEHDVTIEIWSSYTGNDASYVSANSISDAVIQILRTRGSISIPGYNVIRLLVDNLITDRILTDTKTIIYKSINIRLLLEEN